MGNDYIEAARVFHEITKHSYTSVRSSPHFLDWDIKPLPYKIYPGAASIPLPRDLNLSSTPDAGGAFVVRAGGFFRVDRHGMR